LTARNLSALDRLSEHSDNVTNLAMKDRRDRTVPNDDPRRRPFASPIKIK
jgi:hypothetical protein